jgi:hypothetical protein
MMKKTNILKIAFTFVLAFVITGAFAQSTDVPGTAAQYDETVTTTYMTAGTQVPFYAEPDPFYHTYDPDGAGSLTAGFTWTWAVTVGNAADLTFSQNNAEDNYVAITAGAGASGAYTINVKEIAPAAWGSCSDAGTNLIINVVAQPTATLNVTGALDACDGDPTSVFPATVTATTADGWQNYRLVWSLEIATIDKATSLKDFYYSDETGAGQNPVQFNAAEATTAAPEEIADNTPLNIMTVTGFDLINSKPTVYTYTLTSINDQASRFGEFITDNGVDGGFASFAYNPIAGQSLVITVNPAPATGPIYHIDHTWAQ